MRRVSVLIALLIIVGSFSAQADVRARLLIMKLAFADVVATDRTPLGADAICVTEESGTWCAGGAVDIDPAFITGFAEATIPMPDGGRIVVDVAATGTGIPFASPSVLGGSPDVQLCFFPPGGRVQVPLRAGYRITRNALGVGTARRYAANGSLLREYGQSQMAGFLTEHFESRTATAGFCPR